MNHSSNNCVPREHALLSVQNVMAIHGYTHDFQLNHLLHWQQISLFIDKGCSYHLFIYFFFGGGGI